MQVTDLNADKRCNYSRQHTNNAVKAYILQLASHSCVLLVYDNIVTLLYQLTMTSRNDGTVVRWSWKSFTRENALHESGVARLILLPCSLRYPVTFYNTNDRITTA